tara:strand:+ start:97 stop:1737 length:1641 start_codon:yes stop_codon:yes gene_type:complete
MEHLQLHNGRWRYRRRWPKDIKPLADGGDFFIKALGTSDRKEAKQLRASVELAFNARVDSLRRRLDEQPRELSIDEAVSLAGRWYRDAHNEMETDFRSVRLNENEREQRKETFSHYGEDGGPFDYGDSSSAKEVALQVLEEAGVNALSSGQGFNTLVNLVESGVFELARQGNLLSLQQPYNGPHEKILSTALAGHSGGRPAHTLGDLMEAHREAEEGGWSQSAKDSYSSTHKLLRDVLGTTRAVESIDRTAAREIFKLITALPRNRSKRRDLRGLSVREAVEKGQQLGLPTIAPKTINGGYLSTINAMFHWAEKEDWIVKSPFHGLTVDDPVADADKRDAFSIDQLQKLFGAAPWTPRNNSPSGKPAFYWMPLLALFHGLRLGEVGGLLLDDICEIDGYHVMMIRDNAVRGLKTKQSRRTLPIHSKIIDLGFLDFVGKLKQSRQERLFPEALAKKRGQVGYNVSLWFSAQVKAQELKGRYLTFHALRHSFEDRLREADLHGTALGHHLAGRLVSGTSASYGSGFSTSKLKEAIERVDYGMINLRVE